MEWFQRFPPYKSFGFLKMDKGGSNEVQNSPNRSSSRRRSSGPLSPRLPAPEIKTDHTFYVREHHTLHHKQLFRQELLLSWQLLLDEKQKQTGLKLLKDSGPNQLSQTRRVKSVDTRKRPLVANQNVAQAWVNAVFLNLRRVDWISDRSKHYFCRNQILAFWFWFDNGKNVIH